MNLNDVISVTKRHQPSKPTVTACSTLNKLNPVAALQSLESRVSRRGISSGAIATDDVVSMTTLDSVSVATDKTKRKELNNAIPRVTNKCDNSVNNLEINTDKNTHQTASKYSKIRKVDKVNRLDETNANNTSDNGTLINAQGAENLECLNQTPENVRQTSGTDPSEVRNTDEATKPSKRKRKRGKIQPPLPPPDVVLPQCLVCGSNSSGFHYGANTCEACKVIKSFKLGR